MDYTTNPLSSDSVKDSKEFGLKVMRQCYNRWRIGYGGETNQARIVRFEKNRLYAMGKQPTDQFRDIVKIDGQIAVINLDYSPLAIAPPLLNSKKDTYMERIEKVKCVSYGPVSQSKKQRAKDEALFKLRHAQDILAAQQAAGVQLEEFNEDDPRSEQELEIKFNTTYKQKEEIVMQMGINTVFDQNEWDDMVKDMLIQDIFTCGYPIAKTELDGNGHIKIRRVKPDVFITSYSEMNNFNDWQWQGERREMSISELRLRYPGILSEEQLFQLAQKVTGLYGNPADFGWFWDPIYISAAARPYDAYNISLVDLHYKTLYNLTYEKKVNSYGREIYKPAKKIKPEGSYEKSKPYYVAYHGVWVVDTDHVLCWELQKNMLKDNHNLVEVRSPYSIDMYNNNKCRNTPLVETMIPMIDLLQNIHLQTQKIIATTAPDGFNVDVLGLADIDMGAGVGVISPMQAYGIFLQTGNQYFKGRQTDGNQKQEPPIVPQNRQFSAKLEQLENQWQATYAKLQRITGDNNLSVGNITNQAVANATLNDARDMAENASNYCYKSYLNVKRSTAINIQTLLLDKFFGIDKSFNGYNRMLGEENIKYIAEMGNMQEVMFDTKIELTLDAVEKMRWDNMVQIALTNNQITIADQAKLEMIDDFTYRTFMLGQYVKDNQDLQRQMAKENSDGNTQAAIAAAQAKGQADMEVEALKNKNRLMEIQAESDGMLKKESYSFATNLKIKVAEKLLSDPGVTVDALPDFIWENLGVIDASQKQLLVNSIQAASMQKDAAMQQMAQQQQAQQAEQPGVPQEQIAAA